MEVQAGIRLNSGSLGGNSKTDPFFREVKIFCKLFIFHTFYLPKQCGINLSPGKSSLLSFTSPEVRKTLNPGYE